MERLHAPAHVIARTALGSAGVMIAEAGALLVVPTGADPMRRDAQAAAIALLTQDPDSPDFIVERFRPCAPLTGGRLIEADQTNESVVIAEQVVVKWQVLLAPSASLDRIRRLRAAGFVDMPEPVAALSWRGMPIATASAFMPGAQDGWDWAVADLRAWALAPGDEPALAPIAEVGAITGRMHRALSSGGTHRVDAAQWRHRAQAVLEEALSVTSGSDAEQLTRLAPRITAEFAAVDGEALTMPIHGDLHIGQFLADPQRRLLVTDFDGNPVLDAEERSAPASPARDVAGVLASLDHVARVVIHRTEGVDADLVRSWIPMAQQAFLNSYRALAGDLLDERLLRPFQIEQECREYVYAARHLPHWRYVPAAALPDLLPE